MLFGFPEYEERNKLDTLPFLPFTMVCSWFHGFVVDALLASCWSPSCSNACVSFEGTLFGYEGNPRGQPPLGGPNPRLRALALHFRFWWLEHRLLCHFVFLLAGQQFKGRDMICLSLLRVPVFCGPFWKLPLRHQPIWGVSLGRSPKVVFCSVVSL